MATSVVAPVARGTLAGGAVATGPGGTNGGNVQGSGPGGTNGAGGTPGVQTPTDTLAKLLGNLTGANRDAAAAVINAFDAYGLSSLGSQIVKFVQDGYSPDTIDILLQQTPEYKTRFAGNEERLKAGLPVLTPAQYLATEDSYRQLMSAAGLPKGFYDQTSDFADLIGKDVSPTELQGRVQVASTLVNNADPAVVQKFQQFYGGSSGDMVAYVLDPQRAEPLIEQQLKAAQIASADQGLNISAHQAELLAAQGITQSQAISGFGQVKQEVNDTSPLNDIYGTDFSASDAEKEVFQNDADAAAKHRRIAETEHATFSGTTGVGAGSLNTSTAGQI